MKPKQAVKKLRQMGFDVDYDKQERMWYVNGVDYTDKEVCVFANKQKRQDTYDKREFFNLDVS